MWVLDTETKGTGANIVPLEKALEQPKDGDAARRRKRRARQPSAAPAPEPRARKRIPPRPEPEQRSTPLPPGHVRKKATGEIGRVRSVDPKAGTADVLWLRQGRTSTVPLTAISRR